MYEYHYWINELLYAAALVIFVSGVDDFFIDVCYWVRRAYRALFVRRRHPPLSLDQLKARPEQPIAVMIPAWREHDVIAHMLEANLKFVDYRNYHFFVGVYANDPATGLEVDRVAAGNPNVHKIVVPHDGPTCKADCLNWVIQGIALHERQSGSPFAMIVMHDSEDVIHPYELRLFNYLVPRKDFVQIPVRCLETPWSDFIRGTYIDEFSEFHNKDMAIREVLLGIVPSAGVASCFSRRAIEYLSRKNGSQPFNTDSLTEDYDISYNLARHGGMRQIFVTFPVSVAITKDLYPDSHKNKLHHEIPIAVAEYFPNRFWAAVRQRTRWNIGIFYQAAGINTWRGGFFHKYYFFHDRKGILTNFLTLPAYFLSANVLAFIIGREFFDWPHFLFDLPDWLIYGNILLLANRVFQRAYFAAYLYNWRQGLLSIPRIAFSNVINFAATVRATFFFARHLVTGRRIAWDKTSHEYPSLEALERRYKRLGVLLVEQNLLDERQLGDLLAEQAEADVSLGQLVLAKGILTEGELLSALAGQSRYPKGDPARADPAAALRLLPGDMILETGVFPLGRGADNALVCLVTRTLDETTRVKLREHGFPSLSPRLVPDKDMERMLGQIRRKLAGRPRLGDLLLARGLVDDASLADLLARQRAGAGALGTLAVADGRIREDILVELLSEQTGYPPGDPAAALDPGAALELVSGKLMRHHRIYPRRVDDANGRLALLVDRELSSRTRRALAKAGHSRLEPFIVPETVLDRLLEPIDPEDTPFEYIPEESLSGEEAEVMDAEAEAYFPLEGEGRFPPDVEAEAYYPSDDEMEAFLSPDGKTIPSGPSPAREAILP